MGEERVQQARLQTLKSDFEMLHVKEDETIDTFTTKLTTLVNKAASLGHIMEDGTLVRKLLNAIPDRYLQIVASIEQYSDLSEMTLEEAIGRLKTYEERIKYKRGKQVDNQESLLFTRHEDQCQQFRKHGHGGFKKSRGQENNSKKNQTATQINLLMIKVLLLNEVSKNRLLMLSGKEVLHDSSKWKRVIKRLRGRTYLTRRALRKHVKLFHLTPSHEPRFQDMIELLPRQVYSIKCKIQSDEMLLPDTNYTCYLVFKLSKKCYGLHCPVKVKDVLHWKNKEIGILYFRTPNLWKIHDNHRVPKKREDGWMEVIVWKFNLTSELRKDYIPMHLKLIVLVIILTELFYVLVFKYFS
nr:serine/threonine-protein kinase, active site protein [Tanacetum cinerariifolium]